MYGPQPTEQSQTLVQTNDPQPDHYGPSEGMGAGCSSLEINSQEAPEP